MTRTLVRVLLGAALVFAGVSHLTFARKPFEAQVPRFVHRVTGVDPDTTVVASGGVEIALGVMLLLAGRDKPVGRVLALFFVAIFPGNIAQWMHHRDSLGLDSDLKRAIRLLGQPLLIAAHSGRPQRRNTDAGHVQPRSDTARAMTRATMMNDTVPWNPMSIFARGDSGITSVGE